MSNFIRTKDKSYPCWEQGSSITIVIGQHIGREKTDRFYQYFDIETGNILLIKDKGQKPKNSYNLEIK